MPQQTEVFWERSPLLCLTQLLLLKWPECPRGHWDMFRHELEHLGAAVGEPEKGRLWKVTDRETGDTQPCLRTGRDPGVEKEAKVDREAKKYRDQNRVIKRKSINTFPRVSELRMCAWGSWRRLVWADTKNHCRACLALRWSHSAPSWVARALRVQSCPPSRVCRNHFLGLRFGGRSGL